ncbi:fluoride efflux transporter CrcB [Luteococcus sp. Sow4_B9]|uniref:fluoride efflux transporter CrcB n=1 Tax=Luteococcus sp. Sow4_B9 TaxID=3438792 RepID=UPI003F98787E
MVLLMSLAGGVGAVLRFFVDQELRLRRPTEWPVGTLLVNVLGSALLGLLVAGVASGTVAPTARLVLGVGFCGGFTTFSTASLECVELAREGRVVAALGHLFGGAACCLGAALVGFQVGLAFP